MADRLWRGEVRRRSNSPRSPRPVDRSARLSGTSPKPIFLSPPDTGERERTALLDALDSGWVAPLGPAVDEFERQLAATCATAGAVALSSGSAGLHLALLTAGVGSGDEVLVPTLTFSATANAVVYCGARPVFIDVDPATWCIDASLVVDEIDRRCRRGAPPRAVVTVDLYGQCADHDGIGAACRRYGVALVEDAAEAIGAGYRGRPAGSLGDIGVLSFNGNKLITTSGGGAVVSNDTERLARIAHLASQARQPVAHYEHTEIGYNYRLSNLLAAVGCAQLSTLTDRVAGRAAVRAWYEEMFSEIAGVTLNPLDPLGTPNHWLTCLTLGPDAPFDSAQLIAAFTEADIEARPLWKPLHLQPVFAASPTIGGRVAEELFSCGVTLPSAPNQPDFHERIAAVVTGITA